MKKLIALTAASVMASSAAVAAVSLSGSASVAYDESDNSVTTAASLTIAGSNGGTSASATMNLVSGAMTDVSMATSIGPVSIDVDIDAGTVSLGLDVLAGDVSIALDDSGTATISTTVAGVAITHELGGDTSAAASLAGMDVNVSSAGTWDVSTTLNGVTLTVDSDGAVTASMGLAGNTVEITNDGDTTVTVSRDLTSGASLEAAYDTSDSSLTLTASVSF